MGGADHGPELIEFHARLAASIEQIADGYLRLEQHLGEIASNSTGRDMALLQSFDRLTQELGEISQVLTRVRVTPSAGILNWDDILAGIRLESLGRELEGRETAEPLADDVELF